MSLVRVIDTTSHDRTYQRIACFSALHSVHLSLCVMYDTIISIGTRNQLIENLTCDVELAPEIFGNALVRFRRDWRKQRLLHPSFADFGCSASQRLLGCDYHESPFRIQGCPRVSVDKASGSIFPMAHYAFCGCRSRACRADTFSSCFCVIL